MASSDTKTRLDEMEAETRRKYSGAFYRPETIMKRGNSDAGDYFACLEAIKIGLVRKYGGRGPVLDLCCATGEHLLRLGDEFANKVRIGIDFSFPFLKRGVALAGEQGAGNISFLCGNARQLPFAEGSFDLIYCFSALYHLPGVDESVKEIGRVLAPDGIAIIELGNLWSLNTVVCRAHRETAAPMHLSMGEMKRMLFAAGLEIQDHYAFQILPLWGNRPRWLRPLLTPFWKKLMARKIGGVMLDQHLCRLPLLRGLAFRHLFVCGRKSETS